MIGQLKCLGIFFMLLQVFTTTAQDSVIVDEKQYIDSVRNELRNSFENQLWQYRKVSDQRYQSALSTIDSLQSALINLEEDLKHLKSGNHDLALQVRQIQEEMEITRQQILLDNKRFTRLLIVSGPSLLFLILLSTVLFFLLMRRAQEQTDRKINALKKYTYSEIEETRSDLMKRLKKRMKKLQGMFGEGTRMEKKSKNQKKSNPKK